MDDPLSRKAFVSLGLPPGEYAVAQPVFGSFDHQGRTYHTMFAPFSDPQWPWAIGIYLPEDDYLGPIKDNRFANILVMIGVAALASVAGLTIARGVARPMSALRAEAAAVRDGDLGTSADTHSVIKEIQVNHGLLRRDEGRLAGGAAEERGTDPGIGAERRRTPHQGDPPEGHVHQLGELLRRPGG